MSGVVSLEQVLIFCRVHFLVVEVDGECQRCLRRVTTRVGGVVCRRALRRPLDTAIDRDRAPLWLLTRRRIDDGVHVPRRDVPVVAVNGRRASDGSRVAGRRTVAVYLAPRRGAVPDLRVGVVDTRQPGRVVRRRSVHIRCRSTRRS